MRSQFDFYFVICSYTIDRNNGYNFGATFKIEQNRLIPQANTEILFSFYNY